MVEINKELTRKVAHLARLELTDEEITAYTDQLSKILNYIEKLNEVKARDASGPITPLVHPFELKTPLREDQVTYFSLNAEDGFKVPPIL